MKKRNLLLLQVLRRINDYSGNHPRIIVACSGGADSMALLDMARIYALHNGKKLICVHFNHCLRGSESEADEVHVRKYCQLNNIAVVIERCDTGSYAALNRQGIEEAARALRYSFFKDLSNQYSVPVYVAHNREDQAETILLHILRGSGIRGLAGMQEYDNNIVRPLLKVSRKEIEEYCLAEKIGWVTDSTNSSELFLRNYVRNTVLPVLASKNPKIVDALHRLAEVSAAEDEFMDDAVAECLPDICRDKYTIDRKKFAGLPVALQRRTLKKIMLQHGSFFIPYERLEELRRQILNGKVSRQIELGSNYKAVISYDTVFISGKTTISKDNTVFEPVEFPVEIPGILNTAFMNFEFELISNWAGTAMRNDCVTNHVYMALNNITGSLILRPRRRGDRISLRAGSRSVKKLFIDKKVPLAQRDNMLLLVDDENVLWIPGIALAKNCCPDKSARNILKITFKEKQNA